MNKFLYLIIVSLFLSSCKLADIRTEYAEEHDEVAKSKEILDRMYQSHGTDYLKTLNTYTVLFEDEFYGFIGKSSHPYKEDLTQFKLSYIPETFDGRLKFVSGKWKGNVWGIQSWKTYNICDDELKFKKSRQTVFWVPTYQYFIEFPLRIINAEVHEYAGSDNIEGVDCDGVVVSWKSTEPQKEIDQYVIWCSKETGRIVKLEYTIREKYKFLTGFALFKDYKEFNGYWLPSKMPVYSNLLKEGECLHEMRILKFHPNELKKDEIRPDKKLKPIGDSKK